jgi:hypothetical protein
MKSLCFKETKEEIFKDAIYQELTEAKKLDVAAKD